MKTLPEIEMPVVKQGELGKPFIVLSTPEIRQSRVSSTSESVDTADGPVLARVGDIVVSMTSGERYPIPREIFFGTYEVLVESGGYQVGRRILQARFAWEVVSAAVEISYGEDRGTVSGKRGDWIYQSDDNDYGLINSSAALQSYVNVGSKSDFDGVNWTSRTNFAAVALIALAPVLTLLALLSFAAFSGYLGQSGNVVGNGLLIVEGLLLISSMAVVYQSRRHKWTLKQAVEKSYELGLHAGSFVSALGETLSTLFPNMTLWRAVQKGRTEIPAIKAEQLELIKKDISDILDKQSSELKRLKVMESAANTAIYLAAAMILGTICLLLFVTHSWWLELISIWLPSLVAAMHAFSHRRNLHYTISSIEEFVVELTFVRKRLTDLTHNDRDIFVNTTDHIEVSSILQFLCKAIAQLNQKEVGHAVASLLNPPV